MKVLICGGGIGGLTTALSCLHHGFDVEVFEQASVLSEVGAGLQLSPNAMRVFRVLGLEDEIIRLGVLPTHGAARLGKSGFTLFEFGLGDAAKEKWGAPYVHIHRADLLKVLQEAVVERARNSLHLSHKARSYQQDGEQVKLGFANGNTALGDILIGADGLHSVIRAQMLGADEPRYTGNMAWRAVIPLHDLPVAYRPEAKATVWMGERRHAVTYLLRGGSLVNFVGVVERDGTEVESWSQQGSRDEALSDFAGWHPEITSMLERSETLYKWALYDRAPLSTWSEGRVGLLGDACHPMLPFMAQGAAMAIEDAWLLASCLKAIADPAEALKTYEAMRKPRTSRVQSVSRSNARTFHHKGALNRLIHYGPMWAAGKLVPDAIRARQDWIYGYDVVEASKTIERC